MGDGAFLAGINRLVLHHAVHQPWDDKYRPGMTMGRWGTHFGRLQTWWEPGKAWLKYLSRCQALLQWGTPASLGMEVVSADTGLSVRALHRSGAGTDVFFVANLAKAAGTVQCRFKVVGNPELWNPVTGEMRVLPEFSQADGSITVPLRFEAQQSFFVVFRQRSQKSVASSQKTENNFQEFKVLQEIAGQWDVSFDPKWGGPKAVVFEKLEDWTVRQEEGIKYYSGTAVYRKIFDLAEEVRSQKSEVSTINSDLRHLTSGISPRLFLDLGVVKHIARVRLNGKDLGVVWCAPWGVTVPGKVLKPKGNKLEIEVTNLWANRLIGDEQEPADCEWKTASMAGGSYLKRFPDWFVKCQPRPSKNRYCFTTWNYFKKDSSLVPSGLLGPVNLMTEK